MIESAVQRSSFYSRMMDKFNEGVNHAVDSNKIGFESVLQQLVVTLDSIRHAILKLGQEKLLLTETELQELGGYETKTSRALLGLRNLGRRLLGREKLVMSQLRQERDTEQQDPEKQSVFDRVRQSLFQSKEDPDDDRDSSNREPTQGRGGFVTNALDRLKAKMGRADERSDKRKKEVADEKAALLKEQNELKNKNSFKSRLLRLLGPVAAGIGWLYGKAKDIAKGGLKLAFRKLLLPPLMFFGRNMILKPLKVLGGMLLDGLKSLPGMLGRFMSGAFKGITGGIGSLFTGFKTGGLRGAAGVAGRGLLSAPKAIGAKLIGGVNTVTGGVAGSLLSNANRVFGTKITGAIASKLGGRLIPGIGQALLAGEAIKGGLNIGRWGLRKFGLTLTPVEKLRMMDYGLERSQRKHFNVIFKIEQILSQYLKSRSIPAENGEEVKTVQGEIAKEFIFDYRQMSEEDVEEVVKLLEIDPTDPEFDMKFESMVTWMRQRVIPIFNLHLNAVKRAGLNKDFTDIKDFSPEEVSAYIAYIKENSDNVEQYYDLRQLPFEDSEPSEVTIKQRNRWILKIERENNFKARATVTLAGDALELIGIDRDGNIAARAAHGVVGFLDRHATRIGHSATGLLNRLGITDATAQAVQTTGTWAVGLKSFFGRIVGRVASFGKEFLERSSLPLLIAGRHINRLVSQLSQGMYRRVHRWRMFQYGLGVNHEDLYPAILQVEMILKDYLKEERSRRRTGRVNPIVYVFDRVSEEDMEQIYQLLGVNKDNEEQLNSFMTWFTQRFMFVLLTHVNMIRSENNELYVDSLERLSRLALLNYIRTLAVPDRIYEVTNVELRGRPITLLEKASVDLMWKASERSIEDQRPVVRQSSVDLENRAIIERANRTPSPAQTTPTATTIPTSPSANPGSTTLTAGATRGSNVNPNITRPPPTVPRPSLTSTDTIQSESDDAGQEPPSRGLTGQTGSQVGRARGTTGANIVNVAKGDLYQGGNREGLDIQGDADFEGLNPNLKQIVEGMANEYFQLTGRKIPITSAWRSPEKQAELRRRYGNRAARPGHSIHEHGLALDIDSSTANELDALGLLGKYGLTRPVGQEPWHLEPAMVAANPNLTRRDEVFRQNAVAMSLNKGGGGYALLPGARRYGRDVNLQKRNLQVAEQRTYNEIDPFRILGLDSSDDVASEVQRQVMRIGGIQSSSPSFTSRGSVPVVQSENVADYVDQQREQQANSLRRQYGTNPQGSSWLRRDIAPVVRGPTDVQAMPQQGIRRTSVSTVPMAERERSEYQLNQLNNRVQARDFASAVAATFDTSRLEAIQAEQLDVLRNVHSELIQINEKINIEQLLAAIEKNKVTP